MDFKDKIVLATGASTGIGKAIATAFTNQGAQVLTTSRSSGAFPADLSTAEGIIKLTEEIKAKCASIYAIINVAAIWHTQDKVLAGIDFDKFSVQEIVSTLNVGTLAPLLLVNQLLPLMPSGGKVVNISGTFESGAKGWLPYYVSKKAIEAFTIGLAQELANKNIQVNCVSPSDTLTESYKKFFPQSATPDQGVGPEQVANEVLSFANPSSAITGQIKIVKK